MNYNAKSSAVLIRFFILLTSALCALSALATTPATTWIGTTGDWFNDANWSNHVPNISTDAYINNGGNPQIANGSAAAHSLVIGNLEENSGSVQVMAGGSLVLPPTAPIGATFPVEGTIYIGYQGKGTLNITNGGAVSCGYGYIAALGPTQTSNGSNGVVTVDGTGSTWTLTGDGNSNKLFVGGITDIGNVKGGTGLLSITNGGHVTVNNPNSNYAAWVGASGTLTGNGTLTANGNSINARLLVIVGTLLPAKSLTIDGNLGFNTGSAFVCNVTSQDVNVTSVPLGGEAFINGGRLSVNMSGPGFTPGARFTLLHAAAGFYDHSTFQSVSINYPVCPTCAPAFTPVVQYDYDSGNVYLYLDPNQ